MILEGNMRIMLRGPQNDVQSFLDSLQEKSGGTLFDEEKAARQYVDAAYVSYFDVIDNFEIFPLRNVCGGIAECSVYVDFCERSWILDLKERFPEVRLCGILRNDTSYAEIYSRSGSSFVAVTDRLVAYRKNISFPVYSWWDKDEPFDFVENPDDTLKILRYHRWDGKLTIPKEWKGRPVTAIADRAFAGNAQLRTVVIEDHITQMGDHVFEHCPNVIVCTTNERLRDKLSREGIAAADPSEDLDLQRIQMRFVYEIADGEAHILSYKGIGSIVEIPETIEGYPVTEIGAEAFCKKEAHKTDLKLEEIIWPNTIRKIGRKAFYDTGLRNFQLPKALELIEEYAFSYCEGAKKIKIPEKLASVEELRDLWRVEEISVTETNPYFQAKDGVLFNKEGTALIWYPAGKADQRYCIEAGVRTIANRAFEINKRLHLIGNLRKLEMPFDVEEIGEKAFGNCENLEEVKLPATLKKLGQSAFFQCSGLKKITIPEGIRDIAYGTFYMCRNLQEVVLPEGIERIGDRAFYSCRSITEIHLPQQLREIGNHAFYDCQFLKEVILSENTKNIGREAFASCQNLARVLLSEQMDQIGRHAFFGCRMLKELEVPSHVEAFHEWTEEQCVLKLHGIPLREVTGRKYRKMAGLGYMLLKNESSFLRPELEKGYEDYIRENSTDFLDEAFQHEAILHFMTEHTLLSMEDIEALMERANCEKNTAAAAILLEYKHRLSVRKKADAWDDILGNLELL